jgi:hypothetical protein
VRTEVYALAHHPALRDLLLHLDLAPWADHAVRELVGAVRLHGATVCRMRQAAFAALETPPPGRSPGVWQKISPERRAENLPPPQRRLLTTASLQRLFAPAQQHHDGQDQRRWRLVDRLAAAVVATLCRYELPWLGVEPGVGQALGARFCSYEESAALLGLGAEALKTAQRALEACRRLHIATKRREATAAARH